MNLDNGIGRLSLEEGRTADLKISANNHEPQTMTVGPVPPGETIEQDIRLALNRWRLKLVTTPSNAKIEARIGERSQRGTGTLELRGLHPGDTVRLKVSAKQCRTKRIRLQSEGREMVEQSIKLRCRKR